MKKATLAFLFLAGSTAIVSVARQQPPFPQAQRVKIETMLADVRSTLAEHYYDTKFHGVNLDERYAAYKQRVDSAHNVQEGLRAVAAFAAGLSDSHTFFEPPALSVQEDYGYQMLVVGERAFVVQLRPGSDAAAKLHIGDEILRLNNYSVNRKDFWPLRYDLSNLEPVTVTQFKRRTPDGQVDDVAVNSKQIKSEHLVDISAVGSHFFDFEFEAEERIHELRQRGAELGDIMIWKMPAFLMGQGDLDKMLALASHHKTLILDLRGNPGGSVDLLEHLLGGVIPPGTQIAERVGRKPMKPMVAKKSGANFAGQVYVLVDSSSASAAEIFARTMQITHRGIVIGDKSSGSVMEARYYPLQQGQGSSIMVFYGIQVTDADVIMLDGQSLENKGVTPDEIVLPTAAELAAGLDPVLAYAVRKAGGTLEPKAAGALFPFEWRPLSLN